MKKICLILNPKANRGQAQEMAASLFPAAEALGGAQWLRTGGPEDATRLAREAAEQGCEVVAALGGDGTLHEVLNGLMQVPAERRPRLGVVPLGSGNDFAHAVGVPGNPQAALRTLWHGQVRRVDVGTLRDEHGHHCFWDNTVGIGFDAIVTLRARRLRRVRGTLVYLVATLQTIISNHTPNRVRFESAQERWDDALLMFTVCNGPREGGAFLIAPQATPDDGHLDYAYVLPISRLHMLRILPEVMRGTHTHLPQIRMGTCTDFTLEADLPLVVHTDGEIFLGLDSASHRLEVSLLPAALEVMHGESA